MRTIWLKPLRDLRRMKLRALSILLMVAVGLGSYAGLYMSRDSLIHTRDTIYRSLRLSDLRVVTTPADPTEIPQLEGLPGVEAFTRRLAAPGVIELPDARPLNSLIVYLDPGRHPQVNDLEVLEGTYFDPGREHGVLIERSLAEYHGYRIGDRLTLNPYTAPVEVEVIGIVLSPECLIATSDATVFFPLRGSLGVIFAPSGLITEVFGQPLYNEFSFLYQSGADPLRTEQGILAALGPLGIEDVTRRREEFGFRFLQESIKGFSAFLPSLVLVFGVVIFLVTFITANRLVAVQRQEIGVLRSMGYRRGEVVVSFLVLALILGLAGGILGIGLSLLFSQLFATNYADALGLPRVLPVFVVPRLVEGWFMAFAVVALGFIVPLARLVRLSPRHILRAERQEFFTGVPRLFAGLGQALRRLLPQGTAWRYGTRNLWRRPGLTSATVACIALPIALGGAFLVVLHSVDCLTADMFDREKWDVMVQFRYPLERTEAERLLTAAGLPPAMYGASGFGQVAHDGAALNYQLLGFPVDRSPRKFNLVAGRTFRDDREAAILLNRNWLEGEGVEFQVGDWVEVRAGERRERLEVVGLFSDMTVGQAHVPLGIAQKLFGLEDRINGAMALAAGPVGPVKKALYKDEEVAAVYTLAEIRESIDKYMVQMTGIFYTSAGITIVIGVLFLLASVLLNLMDREWELSTLRALGYNRRRVGGILLAELSTEAWFSVLISIPLSVLLAFFINYQQGKIYFPIPTVVRAREVLGVSLWALLFMPLAALPGLRHLNRLNLAEVVRRKIIG